MSAIADDVDDSARRERAIQTLVECETAPAEEVRALFADEFARLESGASVRKYLHALTTTNVRAKLRRRKGRNKIAAALLVRVER